MYQFGHSLPAHGSLNTFRVFTLWLLLFLYASTTRHTIKLVGPLYKRYTLYNGLISHSNFMAFPSRYFFTINIITFFLYINLPYIVIFIRLLFLFIVSFATTPILFSNFFLLLLRCFNSQLFVFSTYILLYPSNTLMLLPIELIAFYSAISSFLYVFLNYAYPSIRCFIFISRTTGI